MSISPIDRILTHLIRALVLALVFPTALITVAPPASAAGTFIDDDGSIHEQDIEFIAAKGITKGCNPPTNDRYCPKDDVTRGQMAAYLARARNLGNAKSAQFTDTSGSTFEADIDKIAAVGITKGCNPPTNDRYCPDDEVTRGQMAAFLNRAFSLNATSVDYFFDDNGSTFEGDINAIAAAGITVGCGTGEFCPGHDVTREQMASFIKRAIAGGLNPPTPVNPPGQLPAPGASKPAGAIEVNPSDDLSAIVASRSANTIFYLTSGIHRMESVKPKDGQQFVGAPGAIMSGARVLTGFQQDGSDWYVTGQTQQNDNHGTCEDGYSGCIYPEQLFIDGVELWQVTSRSALEPGTWYFDYGADRIYIADNPSGHTVETSVVPLAFYGQSSNVTIRDLVIEKYASPAQMGAIHGQDGRNGPHNQNWNVVGNEIRYSASNGVSLGDGMLVKDNYLHHNGRIGIGSGLSENAVAQGNEIAHNCINTGFQCFGWGGGGVKLAGSSGTVLRANYVHHNYGIGMHVDVQASDTTLENNNVVDNDGAGIFVEVSTDAKVRNNTLTRNGYERPRGRGAGIAIGSSTGVTITGNVLVDNAASIEGLEMNRSPGLHDLVVTGNTITFDEGYAGLRVSSGSVDFDSRNINWNNNVYDINGVSAPFRLGSAQMSVQQWKGAGFDTGSQFK
ncbi:MAG TPA: right-handed parallel beta-helix repeat-containing protein [Acidimicrobiia bacterium]|nr:right-handed parallel beta-helix repeat-containing protein [Acidimicrobiia bacterium]